MRNISEMQGLGQVLDRVSLTVFHISVKDRIHASVAQVREIHSEQGVAIENMYIVAVSIVLRRLQAL